MTIRQKKTFILILIFLILLAAVIFQIVYPLSCKVDNFEIDKLTQNFYIYNTISF